MAERIRTVAIVQIVVSVMLLALAIALYGGPATIASLAVTVAAGIATWLLAPSRYGRPAAIIDMGLWVVAIALVWWWTYDWGAGMGLLPFALPIVGIAYVLREPAGTWWIAGLCTVAYALTALWGQLPAEGLSWLFSTVVVAAALSLAGIWGVAGLAWAATRAWRRDAEALGQCQAAAAGEAEERVKHIAGLEQRAAEQAQRLESLGEWALPAIAVHERVIVLPLAGYLDEERGGQARAALLHAIAERRAKVALIDVSLLPGVDATGAAQLRTLIDAGQLLGARVALAGIRPTLANSLMASQIDVQGLCVVRDVQNGIEWALAQTGWRIEANG